MNRDTIAEEIYTTYCTAVGGVAFNGDPLPNWAEFSQDGEKVKQANAWLSAADRVLEIAAPPLNALRPLAALVPALLDAIGVDMETTFQVSRTDDHEKLFDVTMTQLIDNANAAIRGAM